MALIVGFSIPIYCSVHCNLNTIPLEYILISGSINTPIFTYRIFSSLFLAIFFFPDEL